MDDPIAEAEREIAARKRLREGSQIEFRNVAALEMIADDLTRLHAEARMLRYLFATFAARP